MSERKICVYTCITGEYDDLKDIKKEEGIDYLCFTNNRNIKSDTWKVVYIESENLDNISLARKNKIMMNDFIKENYDICVWIDGATVVRGNIHDFLETQCKLDEYDMTVFNHGVRCCVYDEAAAIIRYRKESIEKVKKTIHFLKREKYPEKNGLTETTVLVRKTNSPEVDQTMKLWFELLMKYSIRDQLTFDYAAYKTGIKLNRLNLNVFDNHWFAWVQHNREVSFDSCRAFFGEYKNVDENNFVDVKNEGQDQNNIYRIKIEKECEFVEIYLGKAKSAAITDINTGDKQFVTNCLMIVDDMYILGENSLILRVNEKFDSGDELEIRFNLCRLTIEDYRKLLIKKNEELINTISLYEELMKNIKSDYENKMKNKKVLLKKLMGL